MNKYEIIGIVGEGAYGVVYKAKCKETGEFGKSILNTHIYPNAQHIETLIKQIVNEKSREYNTE